MCDAWSSGGRRIEVHPIEAENGLIVIAGLAYEPIHALQLSLEINRIAGAAFDRQRLLFGAQPRLPLFDEPEVPRD